MREAEGYPGATHEEWKVRVDELKQRIAGSTQIPEELKASIIKRVSTGDELLEIKIVSGGSARFQIGQIGWKHWAIKNDSLRLVEGLSAAAIAITTFAAVSAAAPAVLAVNLIFASIALADRLKNKSASLDDEQYHILMTLKAAGPCAPKELAERLSGLHIYGKDVWTESRTIEALKMLQSVHLGDGSTEALVTQANNGLWSTNGL
jgi:hypothetical protein